MQFNHILISIYKLRFFFNEYFQLQSVFPIKSYVEEHNLSHFN